MKQEALARAAGIGRATVSEIESGKHIPSILVALKLAAALQCDVRDIFTLEDEQWRKNDNS